MAKDDRRKAKGRKAAGTGAIPKARTQGKPNPAKPAPDSGASERRPASPAAKHASGAKAAGRTIPVHALADERVHLAPAHLGRLKQGYLKTLCGLQAVSALSPFALADTSQKRCRTCFGKVDADGLVVS